MGPSPGRAQRAVGVNATVRGPRGTRLPCGTQVWLAEPAQGEYGMTRLRHAERPRSSCTLSLPHVPRTDAVLPAKLEGAAMVQAVY